MSNAAVVSAVSPGPISSIVAAFLGHLVRLIIRSSISFRFLSQCLGALSDAVRFSQHRIALNVTVVDRKNTSYLLFSGLIK